ncbi:BBE domain-containing protein [Streptomyces sp. NPDC091387]|uniref:BBE domain-containing protein n=1 Tax=Streptomyces sp. NPDC091387 TaxID=3365998 RepID=UPI00380FE412
MKSPARARLQRAKARWDPLDVFHHPLAVQRPAHRPARPAVPALPPARTGTATTRRRRPRPAHAIRPGAARRCPRPR